MTPSLATVDVVHTSARTLVVLRGEVDMSNAAAVHERVRSHLPSGRTGLVIHLDEVTYLDSSGLRMLADLAQEPTIELVVISPPGTAARQAIAASHLDQHLDVRDAAPSP